MEIKGEKREQMLAASARFEQAKGHYKAMEKQLRDDEPIDQVDAPDRVETRLRFVHPDDGLALERIIGDNDLILLSQQTYRH